MQGGRALGHGHRQRERRLSASLLAADGALSGTGEAGSSAPPPASEDIMAAGHLRRAVVGDTLFGPIDRGRRQPPPHLPGHDTNVDGSVRDSETVAFSGSYHATVSIVSPEGQFGYTADGRGRSWSPWHSSGSASAGTRPCPSGQLISSRCGRLSRSRAGRRDRATKLRSTLPVQGDPPGDDPAAGVVDLTAGVVDSTDDRLVIPAAHIVDSRPECEITRTATRHFALTAALRPGRGVPTANLDDPRPRINPTSSRFAVATTRKRATSVKSHRPR